MLYMNKIIFFLSIFIITDTIPLYPMENVTKNNDKENNENINFFQFATFELKEDNQFRYDHSLDFPFEKTKDQIIPTPLNNTFKVNNTTPITKNKNSNTNQNETPTKNKKRKRDIKKTKKQNKKMSFQNISHILHEEKITLNCQHCQKELERKITPKRTLDKIIDDFAIKISLHQLGCHYKEINEKIVNCKKEGEKSICYECNDKILSTNIFKHILRKHTGIMRQIKEQLEKKYAHKKTTLALQNNTNQNEETIFEATYEKQLELILPKFPF